MENNIIVLYFALYGLSIADGHAVEQVQQDNCDEEEESEEDDPGSERTGIKR